MEVVAQRPTERAVGLSASTPLIGVTNNPALTWRLANALGEQGLKLAAELESASELNGLKIDATAIIIFLCDVDVPKQIASLRRMRREVQKPAIVVVSPPTTGTGVRRALDAGADALVFEPELELTIAAAVRAVACGQSVVPRKLRTSVERPNLSHRERQVLNLVRNGLTNAQIAERLFLAESTIKSHLSSVFTKFGVRSRKEAAAVSFELDALPDSMSLVSGGGSAKRARE